jgi:hypothetical protein
MKILISLISISLFNIQFGHTCISKPKVIQAGGFTIKLTPVEVSMTALDDPNNTASVGIEYFRLGQIIPLNNGVELSYLGSHKTRSGVAFSSYEISDSTGKQQVFTVRSNITNGGHRTRSSGARSVPRFNDMPFEGNSESGC